MPPPGKGKGCRQATGQPFQGHKQLRKKPLKTDLLLLHYCFSKRAHSCRQVKVKVLFTILLQMGWAVCPLREWGLQRVTWQASGLGEEDVKAVGKTAKIRQAASSPVALQLGRW